MVTSAALDRTNLHTQVFTNFYNLVNTRSNVVDPRFPESNKVRKFVYAHEPFLGRGFAGYPFVILHQPNVNVGSVRLADEVNAEVSGELVVEVRSSDTAIEDVNATDSEGMGLKWLNEVCDDVVQTFNSVANRNTLRSRNIGFVKTESGVADFIEVDGEFVYAREIRVSFKTALLAVSS